jgi:hypothetical protein
MGKRTWYRFPGGWGGGLAAYFFGVLAGLGAGGWGAGFGAWSNVGLPPSVGLLPCTDLVTGLPLSAIGLAAPTFRF